MAPSACSFASPEGVLASSETQRAALPATRSEEALPPPPPKTRSFVLTLMCLTSLKCLKSLKFQKNLRYLMALMALIGRMALMALIGLMALMALIGLMGQFFVAVAAVAVTIGGTGHMGQVYTKGCGQALEPHTRPRDGAQGQV